MEPERRLRHSTNLRYSRRPHASAMARIHPPVALPALLLALTSMVVPPRCLTALGCRGIWRAAAHNGADTAQGFDTRDQIHPDRADCLALQGRLARRRPGWRFPR